jgi:hypothetical protein
VLHDGFDVEAINKAWSLDIEESYTAVLESNETDSHTEAAQSTNTHGGAVEVYEKSIRDPSRDALQATATENKSLTKYARRLNPVAWTAVGKFEAESKVYLEAMKATIISVKLALMSILAPYNSTWVVFRSMLMTCCRD